MDERLLLLLLLLNLALFLGLSCIFFWARAMSKKEEEKKSTPESLQKKGQKHIF